MKDHPERTARFHLIEHLFAGHRWQAAVAKSPLHGSPASAYRLVQLARDEEKAALALLDRRHGHPYKMTEPVQEWLTQLCTPPAQTASSRLQAQLKSTFGGEVSVSQINRGRAKLGVSTARPGQAPTPRKKN